MSRIPRRWLVLVAMTGSLSMVMLDQTVVSVALPTMTRDLSLSSAGQTWVVNAYVLAMAALVAVGGKLGDRFGGVTTFRVGVSLFFLASLGCGFAPAGTLGEAWIIAFRVLQGTGAALMIPASSAVVVNAFGAAERGRAMATYAGIAQVFLAVGPLVGGALTEWVSWRTVFWLNAPMGLLALVLVAVARPDNQRRPEARVKVGSVVVLVAGLGSSVLGLQQASTWGWGSPATLATLGVGLALTAAFTVSQLRSADPVVDVRLLARRDLVGNFTVIGLTQFGLLAIVLFSSLYWQNLLHFGPIAAGVAALPLILPITAAAQLGGRWYDRAGVRPPVLTGLGVGTVGLVAWTATLPMLSYAAQIPGLVLTGLGLGLLLSPTLTDAMGRVSAAARSQCSGLLQTVRQLGGTLGVALIGTLVLQVLHQADGGDPARHAAVAVTVGFAVAAAAFLVALFAGARLLPRARVEDGAAEGISVDVVG